MAVLPINATQRAGWFMRVPRVPATFAALVTAIAGFLDAVGYVQLSHLYVSFMSGNSTHLGMSIAAGVWSDVCSAALVIVAFVVGASLGTITADRAGEGRIVAVLSAECLVLLIAFGLALAGYPRAALLVVAAAMGVQNALHQLIAGADVGRSFITGTLFGLGQSLAQILVGKGCTRRAMLLASSWLSFVSGAVAGTVAFAALGLLPSLAFVIALLSLAILLLMLGLF